MGVSCVHSIGIPEGKSGQQVIETICSQLESMSGRKNGTYFVECDTYSSVSITPSRVLNVYHSSEYPLSCFALLDSGQSLIADSSLDMILNNLSNVYTNKKMSKIECRGQKWTLKDFVIRIGSCSLGPSLKGVIVEIEYKPCVLPNSCWDLIKELAQTLVGTAFTQPNHYMISKMNEIYSPIDTIQQYNDVFNTLRKANTNPNLTLKSINT